MLKPQCTLSPISFTPKYYVDRWIFSQTIATVTLLVLMLAVGISRHAWLDLLHMWFVTMAINSLRLTLFRGKQ